MIPVAHLGLEHIPGCYRKGFINQNQIARALKLILNKHKPLVTQMVKNPLAVWETWVRSLGREDPLLKEMATHSSIFAWKIPWTEEPGRP